jgi:hypothetical protein
MSERMFNKLGNIEHLMQIEKQLEKDDEQVNHVKERIKLNDLISDKEKEMDTNEVICTFDPMKTSNKDLYDDYDSLNESLRYIKEESNYDKKETIFSTIRDFKHKLLETIVIINNFFDNFSNELQSKETEFDIFYENCIRSFEHIKTSLNEIIKKTELNLHRINTKSVKIESFKSVSQVGSDITCIHRCNTPDISLFNLVIDKITHQQKEIYETLKKEKKEEIETLKNKLNQNDKTIESSTKLIEELYSKNQKLKEKLIKYKSNYEILNKK